MGLKTNSDLMIPARAGGYAVGAFNTSNIEISRAIFEAAAELKSPVIVATSQSAIKYAGYANIHAMVENLSDETGVPASLHLDHGTDLGVIEACLDNGWSSIMIDGSHLPFEENIAITKKVVEYAHPRGVTVEAELGQLGGIEEDVVGVEDISAHLADPKQVVEFVEKSGCDSLAIACGTSHGAYKFKTAPTLAFDVIEEIGEKLPGYPLVMHGSSSVLKEFKDLINKYGGAMPDAMGVPEEMVTRASKMAMCKVNIDTDLRMALTAKIRQVFAEKPAEFDPRKYLGPGRDAIREMVRHKLDVLGCAGKAPECM